MNFLAKLERRRLLAILRCDDVRRAADCIRVFTEENIDLVEVSLTSDRALSVLSEARGRFGDAVELGAGTVMTPAQAHAAIDAGAGYLVTPSLSAGALEGIRLGVPVLVGALTPTEISIAVDHGATAVKLFPAEFGGPAYLKALRSPLPDVPFVPVGGVDASLARAFLDAGHLSCGRPSHPSTEVNSDG